ncbi:MAG: glycogen/starch/alpha-glucan phosphorylase [Firmicutes bacterium]|nr:glycogen/starch/alpha-glucan phosphorylase [Bacillota bacterium]
MTLSQYAAGLYGKALQDCSDREIYSALLRMTAEKAASRRRSDCKKKIYYISAEFLIGKLLGNNLINLGIYDEVRSELCSAGKSLAGIEELEPEPSLGNGGLGRLAACFLDSMATLGLAGDGIGIAYHFGLFRQEFCSRMQAECPNPWMEREGWMTPTDVCYPVSFGALSVQGHMYDIPVIGYEGVVNHLHLFDLDTVDESIVHDGIKFDQTDIAKNLTLFLYPDDSSEEGRLLRIYQQYFMVSCAAQLILDEVMKKGCKLHDLADYAAIQINDTHPTMIIPELIRLLQQHGIGFEEAVRIVTDTCAYTNHTILAEALETWPLEYLQKAVPQLVPVIRQLDRKIRQQYDAENVQIIDSRQHVHMAHLDIHFTHSTNGVADLHTEILKNNELNSFYRLYPDRFNNKTNGITFRRWLLHCNPGLTQAIESRIGPGFKKNAEELQKLKEFSEDNAFLERLLQIRQNNKSALAEYLARTQGIRLNCSAIFDIQIKRLHEYKRQQMNALELIHRYLDIKRGNLPETPVTALFGAKAAPAYTIAKDIIHLILCLQQIVNQDPQTAPWLQIFMVENYNVTHAEKLIPACDISEQISLASKEASGTGNMKLMLNGAVTLGTMDGANVEIAQLVGPENIYTFGADSKTVMRRYEEQSYHPEEYYESDPTIREAIDFITGKEMMQIGCCESLSRLSRELIRKDWFMALPDFQDYSAARQRAYHDYRNRRSWAQKMLANISNAGFFSSDRTIAEYNRDIWHACASEDMI